MKTLFKVLAGLVVVIIIAVIVVVMNLDRGVKAIIEEMGPKFVQADVTVKEVNLSLSSGEGRLGGLVIGNPAGFASDQAFSLGEIALAVEPESLAGDTVVIKSLRIIAPEITYEMAKGGSNLSQMQNNVEQAVARYSGGGQSAAADSGPGKKLIIRDFLISDGQIHYSNPLLSDKTVDLALPRIKLTGIGEKSGGATAVEVVDLILSSINKEAVNAIAKEGLLKGAAEDAIKQGKSKLEEKLGGFKGLLDRD